MQKKNSDITSRVSIGEIARDLNCGRQLVYKLLRSGVIPNIPVGRTWLVTRSVYEEWKQSAGRGSRNSRSSGAKGNAAA